jgi:GDP-L-fucose synthase
MEKDDKIFVAGHRGLVGSAIVRTLQRCGFSNLLLRSRAQCDLTDQQAVRNLFAAERPDYVFLAAAKVGGIHANATYPAQFIYENLAIQNHIVEASYRHGAKKLLFLGSSCIYPKHAPQPMTEDCLLSGPLEATNQWYAVAKIAGIKLCQAFRRQYGFDAIAVMPTNLYGPGDNFDLENSHVLPALLRKFHEAKLAGAPAVTIWGTGTPRREFLHVDDLAEATLFLMENYRGEDIVNVGCGSDLTIRDLAELVRRVVGYSGEIVFDASRPDGTPRKLLDVGRLFGLGWRPRIGLEDGVRETYRWYVEQLAHA